MSIFIFAVRFILSFIGIILLGIAAGQYVARRVLRRYRRRMITSFHSGHRTDAP